MARQQYNSYGTSHVSALETQFPCRPLFISQQILKKKKKEEEMKINKKRKIMEEKCNAKQILGVWDKTQGKQKSANPN